MAGFERVLAASELAEGHGQVVDLEGRRIAVFRVDGELYAIDDECTHAEASLAEGDLLREASGPQIECTWHGAAFCLKTGEVKCPPAFEDVNTYPVREVDGDIEVDPTPN